MATAVDERGRIVIPKHVAEELGLSKGDVVVFEKIDEHFVIKKLGAPKRKLAEILSWNPKRTGKPQPVSPEEMKGIWKT